MSHQTPEMNESHDVNFAEADEALVTMRLIENLRATVELSANIGAGKSTLGAALIKLGYAFSPERIDEWQPFFSRFGQDPIAHAMTFQFAVLASRFVRPIGLCERSPATGKEIFVKSLRTSGALDDSDCGLLDKYFSHNGWHSDVTIHIDIPAEVCFDRIHKHRCRDEESGLPLSYIQDIGRRCVDYVNGRAASGRHSVVIDGTQYVHKVRKMAHDVHTVITRSMVACALRRSLREWTQLVAERETGVWDGVFPTVDAAVNAPAVVTLPAVHTSTMCLPVPGGEPDSAAHSPQAITRARITLRRVAAKRLPHPGSTQPTTIPSTGFIEAACVGSIGRASEHTTRVLATRSALQLLPETVRAQAAALVEPVQRLSAGLVTEAGWATDDDFQPTWPVEARRSACNLLTHVVSLQDVLDAPVASGVAVSKPEEPPSSLLHAVATACGHRIRLFRGTAGEGAINVHLVAEAPPDIASTQFVPVPHSVHSETSPDDFPTVDLCWVEPDALSRRTPLSPSAACWTVMTTIPSLLADDQ